MARWPAPGRCKARLAADLLDRLNLDGVKARSARIQQRLTSHTLAVAAELQRQALFAPQSSSASAIMACRQRGFLIAVAATD